MSKFAALFVVFIMFLMLVMPVARAALVEVVVLLMFTVLLVLAALVMFPALVVQLARVASQCAEKIPTSPAHGPKLLVRINVARARAPQNTLGYRRFAIA